MTATGMVRAQRLTRRRAVVAVLFVVTLGAVAAVHQLWWIKPTAFGGWGNGFTAAPQAGPYRTMNVGVSDTLSNETISVHSVKPVILQDTAESAFEFVICTRGGKDRLLAVSGTLDDYCTSTTPVAGHELNLGDDDQYVIMRMTPSRAGETKVEGVKFTYRRGWRHGWQTGTERAGPEVLVTHE